MLQLVPESSGLHPALLSIWIYKSHTVGKAGSLESVLDVLISESFELSWNIRFQLSPLVPTKIRFILAASKGQLRSEREPVISYKQRMYIYIYRVVHLRLQQRSSQAW